MKRQHIQLILGILVSGGAATWFAWGIDWSELGGVLAGVSVPWLLASAAVLLGEFVLRAFRWKVLLRPLGTRAKVGDLFAAQVGGAATNTLFPLRAGEVAKPLIAARRTGYPIAAVVATAVMERVYDLFGMITVLLLMVAVLPEGVGTGELGAEQAELVRNLKLYGGMFGAFAFVCMGIFFVLATRERAARGIFAGIVRVAPAPIRDKLLDLFDGFVSGLSNARDKHGLWQAGLLSVWMWVNGAVAIWFLFRAFGMDLPFGAACFVGVAIALTVALPQAPGFIGVFHVAMEKTMELWGQPDADSQGFAIMFWAVSFLPVTTVGLVALWREGVSVATLRKLPADPSAADPASPGEASAPSGSPTTGS